MDKLPARKPVTSIELLLPPDSPAALRLLRLAAIADQQAETARASDSLGTYGFAAGQSHSFRFSYGVVTGLEISDAEMDDLVKQQRDEHLGDE